MAQSSPALERLSQRSRQRNTESQRAENDRVTRTKTHERYKRLPPHAKNTETGWECGQRQRESYLDSEGLRQRLNSRIQQIRAPDQSLY